MFHNRVLIHVKILQLFLLLTSFVSYNKTSENDDENTITQRSSLEQTETVVDLRKFDVDIDEELEKQIKTKLKTYKEIHDFVERPSFDLIVMVPSSLDRIIVPETVKEIIDRLLSNAFKTQAEQPVYFSLEEKTGRVGSEETQEIEVIFKLASEIEECLEKSERKDNSANGWCHNKIIWNSNEKTSKRSATAHVRNNNMRNPEKLKIIDMTAENWILRLDYFVGDMQRKKADKDETSQLDINILPPPIFQRTDFLMMLKHINTVITRRIPRDQFVKYLVYPRMHGNKIRDLNMLILISPRDLQEEENQKYVQNMCLQELIPRLQKEYRGLMFRYETVFNAVEVDQKNQMDNRYRVVLNVFGRNRDTKISFAKIRNIVFGIRHNTYPDIRFKSSYNDFDYADRNRDYLIVSFEIIEPTFENTKDFIQKTFKTPLQFYLKQKFPNMHVGVEMKHNKPQYYDMYDEDQYEIYLKVLKGSPNQITPEMLKDILAKINSKNDKLEITCEVVSSKYLKLCLEVKKINVNCYNPWTKEGKKEFFLSQKDVEETAVVPPGGTPPKEQPPTPPPGILLSTQDDL